MLNTSPSVVVVVVVKTRVVVAEQVERGLLVCLPRGQTEVRLPSVVLLVRQAEAAVVQGITASQAERTETTAVVVVALLPLLDSRLLLEREVRVETAVSV